jgi:hypothetical protein
MKFSTLLLITTALVTLSYIGSADERITINNDVAITLPGQIQTGQTEIATILGYKYGDEFALYTYTAPIGVLTLNSYSQTGSHTQGGMPILTDGKGNYAVGLKTNQGNFVIIITTLDNVENAITKVVQV